MRAIAHSTGMPTVALVLSALWLLTAVVLRVAIQVRRTGDTGLRLTGAERGSSGWWAAVAFTAGIAVVVAGPLLLAVGVVEPRDGSAALQWAGLVLASTGVVGTFAAQLDMGASWRVGVDPSERTALVTAGLFRWVRNPIFTAMLATAAGLTALAPTVVGVAGCAVVVLAVEAQVRWVEEPYLRDAHGDAYRTYAAAVGRFVPLVGRTT